jgi:hypothetical protein
MPSAFDWYEHLFLFYESTSREFTRITFLRCALFATEPLCIAVWVCGRSLTGFTVLLPTHKMIHNIQPGTHASQWKPAAGPKPKTFRNGHGDLGLCNETTETTKRKKKVQSNKRCPSNMNYLPRQIACNHTHTHIDRFCRIFILRIPPSEDLDPISTFIRRL